MGNYSQVTKVVFEVEGQGTMSTRDDTGISGSKLNFFHCE